MNDLVFFVVPIITIAICAGVWNLVRELFTRWVNNDWCKHDWGKWKDGVDAKDQALISQGRWCTKCNKMEKRHL